MLSLLCHIFVPRLTSALRAAQHDKRISQPCRKINVEGIRHSWDLSWIQLMVRVGNDQNHAQLNIKHKLRTITEMICHSHDEIAA